MGTTLGKLVLEDGTEWEGLVLGFPESVSGEVVFNTGMVGYPEALTDPSYYGQILVLTYPLIGNYGVPPYGSDGLNDGFESERVQISALIVDELSASYNHWNAYQSLEDWLQGHRVPVLSGVDTRALTKRLRQNGTMLGRVLVGNQDVSVYDPNKDHVVRKVATKDRITHAGGEKRVLVVDCGCKTSIIRCLLKRGVTVIRVPWDYDFLPEEFDGLVISNGPGDPKSCTETISNVKRALQRNKPIFGICLGNQILALAAGGDTYKMKFGHRGQNQPCRQVGTRRCLITSQNHGYAVSMASLPEGWEPWFVNANDGSNEGIRHRTLPFMSVQFHPEANPGPEDPDFLFDQFVRQL